MDAARDRGRRLTTAAAGRPFLVVNPRSGGQTPTTEDLVAEAERRGVETHVLGRGEDADRVARVAADRGAAALGMAGGDGSLGHVARVTLECDLPFVPVPAGTRNHFARDVGFDTADPLGALAAFEGEERRVDVGLVGDGVFLNNVSLGLYASLVHDPRHRTKNRLVAALRMLPASLGRTRRPLRLSFDLGDATEEHEALLVVVANNDYDVRSMADLGTRERLDEGRLHAYVLEAVDPGRLVALLARAAAARLDGAEGWMEYAAARFSVDARRGRVHAAIDGEPVVLPSPLEFEVRPRALRVLIPRARNSDESDSPRH